MTANLDAEVLAQAARWSQEGQPVALATVIRTWGSAPRRAGSHMALTGDGRFVGSVSGGCVENAVLHEAEEVLSDGRAKRLEYGVTDDQAWEVGLACGGTVVVFLERVEPDNNWLLPLGAAIDGRRAVVSATRLRDGEHTLCYPLEAPGQCAFPGDEVQRILHLDQAAVLEDESGDEVFLRPHNPPARLLVIGAVHIAQPLSRFAAQAGFAVTVVDPREAYAAEDRFPGVDLDRRWPAEALAALEPDHRTALVTLTHDPKLDDPALRFVLGTGAFYIGALGSRKTQAKRIDRLRAAGFDEETLARIHGPAGLPIGARTPGEIALSILSEVVATLRGANG